LLYAGNKRKFKSVRTKSLYGIYDDLSTDPVGLLTLTIQFLMAPTHTIGGINYADVWHTTFTIIGVTLIFAGIATEVYTEAVIIRREALAEATK
jgi:hypothetical protein